MNNIILHKIRKRPAKREFKVCASCGKPKDTQFYDMKDYMKTWEDSVILQICVPCAMREEFGSSWANNRRSKIAKEAGLI